MAKHKHIHAPQLKIRRHERGWFKKECEETNTLSFVTIRLMILPGHVNRRPVGLQCGREKETHQVLGGGRH